MPAYTDVELAAIVDKIPRDCASLLECSLHRPELRAPLTRAFPATASLFAEDPEEPNADQARRLLLERWDPAGAGQTYDAIVCADSLAEVRDHDSVLENLQRGLNPGGTLVLTLPNLQYFEVVFMVTEGRWEYTPGAAVARNFLRFFTPKSINKTLTAAGYAGIRIYPLRTAPEKQFPRDASRCVQRGRVSIGPLSDSEYMNYRTEFLLIAACAPKSA
ncbi:MAG: methyltransferase domain-containing protein [Candidatus Hydrogenedentes bacterium]|nr:methyltransferase domain-containing protein [Candidatus Hydrogenedentota bacterium]